MGSPKGHLTGGPVGCGGAQGPSPLWCSDHTGPPGAVPQDLTDRCQQGVREHCTFCHELLELRQWIATVSQKLQSHREDTGPWDAPSREVEVEVRRLTQFPPLPPKKQAWEAKDPTRGDRRPLPRPLTVRGRVSCRGCWLSSRRRRPSCPWLKRTASW